jgi:hypothetical protein
VLTITVRYASINRTEWTVRLTNNSSSNVGGMGGGYLRITVIN